MTLLTLDKLAIKRVRWVARGDPDGKHVIAIYYTDARGLVCSFATPELAEHVGQELLRLAAEWKAATGAAP
jgi:hypothetical protein